MGPIFSSLNGCFSSPDRRRAQTSPEQTQCSTAGTEGHVCSPVGGRKQGSSVPLRWPFTISGTGSELDLPEWWKVLEGAADESRDDIINSHSMVPRPPAMALRVYVWAGAGVESLSAAALSEDSKERERGGGGSGESDYSHML